MLKLEAFVDDKKAGKVLIVLDGLVYDLKMVPARNAVASKGKIREAGGPQTAREAIVILLQGAAKAGHSTISRKTLIQLATETYGFTVQACSTAIHGMVQRKDLKAREKGVYFVPFKVEKPAKGSKK